MVGRTSDGKMLEVKKMRLIDADRYARKFPPNSMAVQMINDEPTVDAVPVVHARWVYGITLRHEWRKCSNCLVSQEIFGCFTYCPNCGARMDVIPDDSGQ